MKLEGKSLRFLATAWLRARAALFASDEKYASRRTFAYLLSVLRYRREARSRKFQSKRKICRENSFSSSPTAG